MTKEKEKVKLDDLVKGVEKLPNKIVQKFRQHLP